MLTPPQPPARERDALGGAFHPLMAAWWRQRFEAPTEVQRRAWPEIAAGNDVLLSAPTGSGKTLAAFLRCLDDLVRRDEAGTLGDATLVVYVSPLKALSNDVRRNLETPLAEIGALATARGEKPPAIRTAVRTGDTSPKERAQAARKPPHVLVTTPESLYILLTSESGRRNLRHVHTVIVDEIHAVLPDKRGAHLALSLERLEALVAPGHLQRVGLSATVRPMEAAARLLAGAARPAPVVVDTSGPRDLDLRIEVLDDELGAVATNEQWTAIYDRLAALAREHKSTLVFVNTRRLVERVALHLGERLGEAHVAAHHGSMSRERRFAAEQRLKAGDLKLVVATASLELGIDIGAVDLTCLVGSPRSIAAAMQRVGRSGHAVGGTPKGRFFPLTRDQLLECAAIVRAARAGELDRVAMRDAPLDILAQQIVAMCGAEDWNEDALFATLTRAAPYAALTRATFDRVVEMLAEGIKTGRGQVGQHLHRDAVNRRLRGRRGARLFAMTSGGAIPDTASYDVVLEPEGTKVGTLDEDFAIESMAGDVVLLGNTSWRIKRVETGKVRVEDGRGAPPTIPFWLGEGPARSRELSAAVGRLREDIVDRSGDAGADVDAWLMDACALDAAGARLLREYVLAGAAQLGAAPSQKRVVAERFFDEAGGMQLVLHAPFGGRINRAWGMALRKSFCRAFDFELQAAATDDGVLLSLAPGHSFPLDDIFNLVRSTTVTDVVTQAALQAPMFETRWRWNTGRALVLPRFAGGKKVPPHLQRMRAQDLLAAAFPAQVACQDNHGGGPIEVPDHPLAEETVRDCLVEATDVAGLREVLGRIEDGNIECLARETPEPSVFSHEILNSNPYTFLDDAPLEERRTRAVSIRRGLPAEVADRIGGLDADAIAGVIEEARPEPRHADELHELLCEQGLLPEAEGLALATSGDASAAAMFDELLLTGRAARWRAGANGTVRVFWIAAERRSLAETIFPEGTALPDVREPAGRTPAWKELGREGALAEVIRGRVGIAGPTTAAALAAPLGLAESDVDAALARVELEGAVLRGRFTPADAAGGGALEWCDRRLLARIHRRTVDGLRREIEPVAASDFIRFLLGWQRVRPGQQTAGRLGLGEVVAQLGGFEAAAGAWEREILPARVAKYDPAWLDALCLGGDVVWGRLSPRPSAGSAPSRAAPVTLCRRSDLPWLLPPRDGVDDAGLSAPARDVLVFLRRAGASFTDEIVHGARRLRSEVDDALWELVAAGRITGDAFGGLRALIAGAARHGGARARFYARWSRSHSPRVGAGRWAVLAAPPPPAPEDGADHQVRPTVAPAFDASTDPALEAKARLFLRRWGVVFRDLLLREPDAPPWRDLVRVLRRLEMRGEIRGGRLVAGFVGEQFALPEAVDVLRRVRREEKTGEIVRVSACDPLNLVGILTPGPRIPAVLQNHVTYKDGVPLMPAAAATPTHPAAPRPHP